MNTVKYCSEGNLHALGLQKYLRVERETSNSIRTAAEKCRIISNGNQGIGRFCDPKTNYCILFGKNRVSKHVFADKYMRNLESKIKSMHAKWRRKECFDRQLTYSLFRLAFFILLFFYSPPNCVFTTSFVQYYHCCPLRPLCVEAWTRFDGRSFEIRHARYVQ